MPFLAASPTGADSATDIFSIGKTVNICMLGIVTMEIMIVARYWTWWFGLICIISYALVYPFVLLFPLVQKALGIWNMAHYGVGVNIMRMPFFWISLVTVYSITFSVRYFERSTKWLFRPDDNMIRRAPPSCSSSVACGLSVSSRAPSVFRLLPCAFWACSRSCAPCAGAARALAPPDKLLRAPGHHACSARSAPPSSKAPCRCSKRF